MKPILTILSIQLLGFIGSAPAQTTLYFNDFSSPESLQDFTIIGESWVNYTPPPLHTVAVENGQVKITSDELWPNGYPNPPVLIGRALLMKSYSDLGSGFTSIFSENTGIISWAFNVANQDGAGNNEFQFILGSTHQDPAGSIAPKGYYLWGGGGVRNTMVLSRFDASTGGHQSDIIAFGETEGLGTMPQMGSFRITFDPLTGEWKLFGTMDSSFENPMLVSTLLGSGVDSTYANMPLPYFGFGGNGTGVDIYDNVSITIPEPSGISLILAAIAVGILPIRRNWRNSSPSE
jgi:hypothetical protein